MTTYTFIADPSSQQPGWTDASVWSGGVVPDDPAADVVEVGELNGSSLTFTTIDTLGSQWSFVGAGDYLGDGKDQILIENTAGNVGIGEVSGGTIHFTTIATGLNEWMFH